MVADAPSRGWRFYLQRRVVVIFFLGFSAGLPFLLVYSTLSAWLRDVGIARTTIGFFSWVGITYSIKVFWAPVIDRLPLPWLTALLGKRRSWMLLAQCTIALGLGGMADPTREGMADLMTRFHEAGIRTVMITGDQSATAHAIGNDSQQPLMIGQGEDAPTILLLATSTLMACPAPKPVLVALANHGDSPR